MIEKQNKEDKRTIYVDVNSLNFWWNIYELDIKTGWEEITIYDKKEGRFEKLANTCICTKGFLKSFTETFKDDEDEKEIINSIKRFINKDEIDYYYYYSNLEFYYGDLEYGEFQELNYENLETKNNIKPWLVEIWHPSKVINMEVIKESVIVFCNKFLNISVEEVIFKQILPLEEAIYMHEKKHMNPKDKNDEDVIINKMAEELSKKWSKSKEDVLVMLKKVLNSENED